MPYPPPRDRHPGDDLFAAAQATLARQLASAAPPRSWPPSLDEVAAEVADLRPLPRVAMKILALDEGRFSAHELATIISSDQALTAKLLRLANSPFYGFARRITTVRDAVVLLGFRAVRGASLTSCVMQTVPPAANLDSNLDYDAFWQCSVATGMLAEVLARMEGRHEQDAFTAGVLHQVGLLALDQTLPGPLREAIDRSRLEGIALEVAERQVFGFTDAELGGALALHWNFPPDLVAAVRDHARPLDTLPEAHSLTAFVLRARLFVRSYGLPDGITARPDATPTPEEWEVPPLSVALRQSGGMAKVMERVDAFLAAALP